MSSATAGRVTSHASGIGCALTRRNERMFAPRRAELKKGHSCTCSSGSSSNSAARLWNARISPPPALPSPRTSSTEVRSCSRKSMSFIARAYFFHRIACPGHSDMVFCSNGRSPSSLSALDVSTSSASSTFRNACGIALMQSPHSVQRSGSTWNSGTAPILTPRARVERSECCGTTLSGCTNRARPPHRPPSGGDADGLDSSSASEAAMSSSSGLPLLAERHTFGRGGIHPGPNKQHTAERAIEDLSPPPREVRLPLLQHAGEPATPLVKKGDIVRRGQKIADGGESGVPLHATISGKIKPIERHPHPTLVQHTAIVIARQDDLAPLEFPEDPVWRACPRGEALARIREAGIVGLGGAAFPTWRKLALARGVDTLIVNGAECEPYLTSDARAMAEHPREVIEGGAIMARLVGAARVLIGIELDKADAAAALARAIADRAPAPLALQVVPCEARYPQGAERQLVQALTGRVVPARQLPTAVGVLVQNVATAIAVHDAVRFRRPL